MQTSFLHCLILPELRAHFEPASETEGGDKDGEEAEDSYQPTEQNRAEDPTAVTSGDSTLSSVASHEAQQQLSLELGRLKQETLR